MRNLFAAATVAVLAASAADAVTIVQYRQTTSADTIQHVNSGSNFTVSSIGTPTVRVTLFDPDDFNSQTVVDALLSFTGTGTGPAVVSGGVASQTIDAGSFSLTALSAFSFGGFTGTNILSGSFTNGTLTGALGTRNPSVSVSMPISMLNGVTSDFFFMMDDYELDNFSITTSGATPALSLTGNGNISNFTASSVGTFDAELAVVPEPATWAMMIAGFGMVGFAARRRKVSRVLA